MIRLAGATLALVALVSPAQATSWMSCSDAEGRASLDYLAGAQDVLSVVALTVSAGEAVWASDVAYGPGEPIAVGQAFEGAGMVLIDAMDAGMTEKIAELRLFTAEEGEQPAVYAGILRIPGHGAWAVSCREG